VVILALGGFAPAVQPGYGVPHFPARNASRASAAGAMTDKIPAEVSRFLLTSIESVPQLETLLLLHRTAPQRWDARALAARIYVQDRAAADALHQLCEAGLLACDDADPPLYWFSPSPPGLGSIVDRTDGEYSRNRVGVTALIHSRPGRGALDFADAFKFRKKESDGG